jgi:hypothetical protein
LLAERVVPAPSEVAPTGEPVASAEQPVRVSAAVATALKSAVRTLRMRDRLPGRACRRIKFTNRKGRPPRWTSPPPASTRTATH